MKSFFVDLHIHLGATATGKPVKITASKSLTLENVLNEAADLKGLDMIGIIDCHVPEVLKQIRDLVRSGDIVENEEGGLLFKDKILFIIGSEIEVYDRNSKGPIHVLTFFPLLDDMEKFSKWFSERVTNIHLSSQRIYEDGITLQNKVKQLGGLFIPAHVFTPFKSLYGKGVEKSLTEVFNRDLIDAIELGLSSDTTMVKNVHELKRYTFLTNSDAHSLANIAREYQKIKMQQPTFLELKKALKCEQGREVEANYGLDPRLGKYYQTTCEKCLNYVSDNNDKCLNCGHSRLVKGVATRIEELSSSSQLTPLNQRKRPPYIHQVPLQFIPGLGPKTIKKLRNYFKTEMNIIHSTTEAQLESVIPPKIADYIIKARNGKVSFTRGGGGKYGKVNK